MTPPSDRDTGSGANPQAPFEKFQALAERVIKVPKATVDQKIRDERAKKRRLNSSR